MNFVQDFLSFGSLGVLGISLVAIGTLGCLVQRDPFRLASCAGISLVGTLLILDGAAKLHRMDAPVALIAVVGIVTVGGIVAPVGDTPNEEANDAKIRGTQE